MKKFTHDSIPPEREPTNSRVAKEICPLRSGHDSAISILAGNSRVHLNESGRIETQAQLNAFDAALRLRRQLLDEGKSRPNISVAFDHCGIFRLQFLDANLSNSQKRRPRLSHLHPSIREIFQPIADKYCTVLGDISAIHEDSARQHLSHILATEDIPEIIVRRIISGDLSASAQYQLEPAPQRLTCAAITKEYFERAAGSHDQLDRLLEVFFEDSSWSERLAYVRGLQLSHRMGFSGSIRLNLVNEAGEVSRGNLTDPRN